MNISFSEFDLSLIGKKEIVILCRDLGRYGELVAELEDRGVDTLLLPPNGYHFVHKEIGEHTAVLVRPEMKAVCSSIGHFEGMIRNRYGATTFMEYESCCTELAPVEDLL